LGNRRILVLGGAGQVGRELEIATCPEGMRVTAPRRNEADITDRQAMTALIDSAPWAAVVNAAAWTAVDAAEDAVVDAFTANALGPAILAEATRRRGIPLVHISTDYVFDGRKAEPYDEGDPVRPLGVYGASKLAGEEAVRTGNPQHVIVRTSWVYGRFGKNFVKTMLRVGAERKTLRVVDDQWGTPTAAADLAAALIAVASRDDLADHAGTYHFANSGETTWCRFARRIFARSAAGGGPSAEVEAINTEDYPTPAKRPANSRLATGRLQESFGIVPRHWDEALGDVMADLTTSSAR